MDFSKVLDDWDKMTAKPAGKKAIRAAERALKEGEASPVTARKDDVSNTRVDPMTEWLRKYGVSDKDADADQYETGSQAGERRRRLLAKRPDAVIDLHGLTRDEAWTRLQSFFHGAREQGLEKVLVIHGKGNNSDGDAVLGAMTRQFIEQCAYAGESGHPASREGGSGSTWVLLKEERNSN